MTREAPTGDPNEDLPGFEDGSRRAFPRTTVADWIWLVLSPARHHKLLGFFTFLVAMGGAFAVYSLKTPMYRAETRILAQRHQALPSVVRPSGPDDSPTRAAWELIHRRENLVALLKQTGILEAGKELPSAGFLESLGATGSDEDPLNLLVKRLDRALTVATNEGTITITLDWPDPLQAYQLVQAALENFLEARQLQEITAIDDAISLLKGRLAPLRTQLDSAIEEAQRDGVDAEPAARASLPRPLPQDPTQSEELGRLRATIEAKERAVRDMEEFRRRRLLELQAQLEERRVVYSEAHPSVVGLRREINSLAQESPQVATLREEEQLLRADYAARVGGDARARSATADHTSSARRSRPMSNALIDQSERVRDARFQYQQMVERVNAAQIQLDQSRAAFKYRYSVVWPAEVPRRPVSPSPIKYLGLGFLGSVALALLAAAAPDLLKGRILERWQVERGLEIPVLAELKRD